MTVTVDPSGSYDLWTSTPAWHFSGTVGYPLAHIASASGIDPAGNYSEIAFDFNSGASWHAAIRTYWNSNAVLFQLTAPNGAANTMAFPRLTGYPAGLAHIAFLGTFAAPTFSSLPGDSPWGFFDSSGNTFVFSAAANFMVSSNGYDSSSGLLSGGISSQIGTLPAGFTHQTLLVVSTGINSAFDAWGQILMALAGKSRPANDADTVLARLGYWTDAGSTYYYNTEGALSYPDTLAAIKAGFDQQTIPLGYMQLDSWFYPKGPGAQWNDSADGIFQYEAAPALFGSSLLSFQQQLGIPLVTHARWIDASSPYRQQYRISGNVSTDPAYWSTVAEYLSNSGVTTYEQDWLSDQAQTAFNLADPDLFLDNMAKAMAPRNLTIQYCMPTPRHFLESTRYANLTTIRASQDRFNPTRWTAFLFASRLASALGIWPFSDVLMSTERDNLLLATLSAGPVGVGDPIGQISPANLLHAVRGDGAIVKPDVPITPLDSSYLNAAQAVDTPMVAAAYSEFGGLRQSYVFAYPQGQNLEFTLRPADLGYSQTVYVYNYDAGSGQLANATDVLSFTIAGTSLYLVVTPVGTSGMAAIGDTGQYVPLGKKRVTAITDNGTIHMTVAFAAGETGRSIRLYAPSAVTVRMHTGSLGGTQYDSLNEVISVTVKPDAAGTADFTVCRSTKVPIRTSSAPARP